MRSELVFRAMIYTSNRFLLAALAAKATRTLHRPMTRIQATTNDVLVRFGRGKPLRMRSTRPREADPFAPVELGPRKLRFIHST
jgi:hypothetical protein